MLARFVYAALRTPPMPYRLLKLAEKCWKSGKHYLWKSTIRVFSQPNFIIYGHLKYKNLASAHMVKLVEIIYKI
jgi:hypothetical protein